MVAGPTSPFAAPYEGVILPRIPGPAKATPSAFAILHLSLVVVPSVLITSSLSFFANYVLFRRSSPFVQDIGRPAVGGFIGLGAHNFFARASVAETRLVFNRTSSYDMSLTGEEREWVKYIRVNDFGARWIAPPGTAREEDEMVYIYAHCGGFTMDSGSGCIRWEVQLVKALHAKGIKFSILSVDYELAPEYIFPSQLIELTAAYHYVVNDLKIPEARVTLGGDSAGGNLALALLLHIARPTKLVQLPPPLGPLPSRPGSALLISPWVQLVPGAASYKQNSAFDSIAQSFVEPSAAHYVGGDAEIDESWNPARAFEPYAKPLEELVGKELKPLQEGEVSEGLELLRSPFVSPAMVTELSWWKEACPADGRTLISWGGREIFTDDINKFIEQLNEAGVAPSTIYGEYNFHIWLPFCEGTLPDIWKTKTMQDHGWAMGEVVSFLEKRYESLKRDGSLQ